MGEILIGDWQPDYVVLADGQNFYQPDAFAIARGMAVLVGHELAPFGLRDGPSSWGIRRMLDPNIPKRRYTPSSDPRIVIE